MWQRNRRLLAIALPAVACAILLPSVAVASTVVQSKICAPFNAPAITAPAPDIQTADTSVHVVGTASNGMTITVLNDGLGAGAAVASSGNFGLEIPLNVGANTLIATTVNDCNTVKSSTKLSVTRTTAANVTSPLVPAIVAAPTTTSTPTLPAANIVSAVVLAPSSGTLKTATALPSTTKPTTPKANAIIANPPATVDSISASDVTLDASNSTTGNTEQVITKPKPNQTIISRHTWIAGQALPLTNVSVYINKALVAKVTSDNHGSYSALVELKDGNNTIHVLAKCSDGQATLRQINVKLTSEHMPAAAPTKRTDSLIVWLIIASFGLGGLFISGSILWHAHHLRKLRRGAHHD